MLQENTLFADRYQLIKLLGRGGFAEVWLAEDSWTHLQIAIKVYAPGYGMNKDGLKEFCAELAGVYDLNHGNLLKPKHVDSWNNMPYLIMSYCSSGSCLKRVGKMSEADIWKLIKDVATGLSYLHRKEVIHQDIKPDNILIDDDGNYLITDFGISTRARSTLRKSVITTSVSGGTMAYMGPERFSHQPAPTKASDIWSLGSMVFELLEGNPPFGELGGGMQKSGAEIPMINSKVSDTLKYVINMMLNKETWNRPLASTLVKWSNNPSEINIHTTNNLKNTVSEKNIRKTVSSNVNDNKKKSNVKEDYRHVEPQKKKNRWLWVLVLILVFIPTSIGIYTFVSKEIDIISAHSNAVENFESSLSIVNIKNIEGIPDVQTFQTSLYLIYEKENNPLFLGTKVYEDKKEELINKLNELYSELDRRYKKAPSGSDLKEMLLNERNKIETLINDVRLL